MVIQVPLVLEVIQVPLVRGAIKDLLE